MRRRALLGAVGLGAAGLAGLAAKDTRAAVATPRRRPVIVDNDWSEGGAATAILPLLADRSIELLGLTAVAGDVPVEEAVAHALAFLDRAERSAPPVLAGADRPLLRTRAEMRAWEGLYGRLAYKGMWDDARATAPAPPPARRTAAPGHAATWMIEQVRRRPGEITLLAAGPLTNVALAVRLDPGFAERTRALVVMGGFPDSNQASVTADAALTLDFNVLFDPEAADIALCAGFPSVTLVGAVTAQTRLTRALVDRIARAGTPLAADYARAAPVGLPMWDELAAAIVADPTLVTRTTRAVARVDTGRGMDYGRVHLWPESTRPHTGEQPVTIVDAVDLPRFTTLFEHSFFAPLP